MAKKKQQTDEIPEMAVHAARVVMHNPAPAAGIMLAKVQDGVYSDVPEDVDCKKGCSFCCHSRVQITHVELKMMETYIRMKKGKSYMDNLMRKAKSNLKKFKGLGPKKTLYLRLPCPLLSKEGECSIYHARPLMCRSFFSTSVQACEAAHKDPEADIVIPYMTGPKKFAEELMVGIIMGDKTDYHGKDLIFIEEGLLKVFK